MGPSYRNDIPQELSHYTKIAIVRNPYTRIPSLCTLPHRWENRTHDEIYEILFNSPEYSLTYYYRQHSNYEPPAGYIKFSIDHLIRFEHYEEDLKKLPFVDSDVEIPHIDGAADKPAITDDIAKNIAQSFQTDFALGNYSLELDKSLIAQYSRYKEAKANWEKHGKPLRTKPEIEAIYKICQDCPAFNKGALWSTCDECGCRLALEQSSMNKIAMATEKCPIGKWPAKIEVGDTPTPPKGIEAAKKKGKKKTCCGGDK